MTLKEALSIPEIISKFTGEDKNQYSLLKGLNPDKPRYLSKLTKTY